MPEPFVFPIGITIARWTRYRARKPRHIDEAAYAAIKRSPEAFRNRWRGQIAEWVKEEIGQKIWWGLIGVAGWVFVSRCDWEQEDEWTCLLIAWGALAATITAVFSALSLVVAALQSRMAGDSLADAVLHSSDFSDFATNLVEVDPAGGIRVVRETVRRRASQRPITAGSSLRRQAMKKVRWIVGLVTVAVAIAVASGLRYLPTHDHQLNPAQLAAILRDSSANEDSALATFDSLVVSAATERPQDAFWAQVDSAAGVAPAPPSVEPAAPAPAPRRDSQETVPPSAFRYDWSRSTVASRDPGRARYVARLVDSLNLGLRGVLRLAAPVPVAHLYCGRVGRDSYLAATRSIRLCEETLEWFTEYSRSEARSESTLIWEPQVLWFILGHELAHSIIEGRDLPIVGDMEAAVDELSGLLLLESSLGGAPLNGGKLFLHALAEHEDEGATVTHHGSSRQRANRLECLYAGKDFEDLRRLYQEAPEVARAAAPSARSLNQLSLGSRQRLEECEDRYQAVRGKWRRILGSSWIARR